MPALQFNCPACNKSNSPTLGAATCSRCSADLTPLVQIHLAASGLQAMAATALRQQAPEEALALAIQSWELLPDKKTAQVAALASGALEDLAGLLHWRAKAL